MEKCHEKLVIMESYVGKQDTSNYLETDNLLTYENEHFDYNRNNVMLRNFNEADENIILFWEDYAQPLQDLVRSTAYDDHKMIEYYRFGVDIFGNL